MTWKTFKDQNIEKWDYSLYKKDDLHINLEKNKRIWKTIGKEICDYYTKNQKIEINYIDYTEMKFNSIGKVHLILLLDESSNLFYYI